MCAAGKPTIMATTAKDLREEETTTNANNATFTATPTAAPTAAAAAVITLARAEL